MQAPMLATPEPREDLFMYLSVFDHVVSTVLLRDRGMQQPVYYVSKTISMSRPDTYPWRSWC